MEEFKRKAMLQRISFPVATDYELQRGVLCSGCGKGMEKGDQVTRVVLGPGVGPTDRELSLDGKPHEAMWAWAHWACATGDENADYHERERLQVLERVRLGEDRDALPCLACLGRIVGGQSFALVAIGPGDDEEQRAHALGGRSYSAVSIAIHWPCATGDAWPERDDCSMCHEPLDERKACTNKECDLFCPT